jgi:hypothetical protein
MAAENRLRSAAAGNAVVAPVVAAGGGATAGGAQQQSAAVAPGAVYTAGILPLTSGGPFDSAQFVGTNVWNGPSAGGGWEVIQAGGVPVNGALGSASPAKAGLFVYTEPADPAATSGRQVTGVVAPSPDPAGMFTVTRVSDGTLTLALSGSAAPYYFDVATGTFRH